MKCNIVSFFTSIVIVFPLLAMDRLHTFTLDLTSAQLPITTTKTAINFEDPLEGFKVLTANKEALLRNLVGKEQGGQYCEELCKAEKLLNQVVRISDVYSPSSGFRMLVAEKFNIDFVCSITSKHAQREWLMAGLHIQDKNKVEWVLHDNCYVVNAYGSCKPYEDRTITPLHHVLCLFADGGISHEYAQYCTEMLLKHGANRNARDDAGNTPMHHASTPELVSLLIQCGAKCNKYGQEGRTPLHNHIRTKNWDVVRCMLGLAADVNVSRNGDNTPLHEAVKQDAPANIIHLLLINGARYNAKNRTLKTPIDMARNKPNLLGVLESYLQIKLCNLIKEDDADGVVGLLHDHSWINLTISGIHILNWAQCFYTHNVAVRVLEKILSGEVSTAHCLLRGVSSNKK